MDWSLVLPWNRKSMPAIPAARAPEGKGLLANPSQLQDVQMYKKYQIEAMSAGQAPLPYPEWVKMQAAQKVGLIK